MAIDTNGAGKSAPDSQAPDARARYGSALGDRGASASERAAQDQPATGAGDVRRVTMLERIPDHLPRRTILPLVLVGCVTFLLVLIAI